jgi:hypothetical protein
MFRLLVGLLGLLLVFASVPGASAQGQIQSLTVSLLPQYDDTRLLIIYTATLDEPGEVLLAAPSGVELRVAAYFNEDGERQSTAAQFEAASDGRFIRVTAPTREVQLELLYDVIPPGPQRAVTFTLPAQRYSIDELVWTTTFPVDSTDHEADPAMEPLGLNHFGMQEWQRDAGPLPAGETASQTISWVRESNSPSFSMSAIESPPPNAERSMLIYGGAALVFLIGGLLVADGIRKQRRSNG